LLSEKSLKSLYFALIHCHLIYCNIIWGCAASNVIQELYIKQKKAIRLIYNKPFNFHTHSLFKKADVLPLPSLIKFSQLQFMHSYVHDLIPSSFERIWATNFNRRNEENRPNLRNDQDIEVPFARTNFAQKMPLSAFPKMWNELSNVVKYDPNRIVFSNKLKTCFLEQLIENFVCIRDNCPCCH
jgi:hypothetical protein